MKVNCYQGTGAGIIDLPNVLLMAPDGATAVIGY